MNSSYIKSILEDKNGNLWFGTEEGGVSKYDGETFIHFTEKEGLSNNRVWSILEDQFGNLWFGTNGGGISVLMSAYIAQYSTELPESGFQQELFLDIKQQEIIDKSKTAFINISTEQGLSNNNIMSIVEDKDGNIWIYTERGLDLLEHPQVSQDLSGLSIINFGLEDGLKTLYFNSNSIIDSKTRLWMGSIKALTMLDLNKFKLTTEPPRIHLNNIEIQEHFIDFHELDEIKNLAASKNAVRVLQT